MDFEGWEVVPNAHHLDSEHASEEELLASYFSSRNNSTEEEPVEDYWLPLEYKDIDSKASTKEPEPVVSDDEVDMNIEYPMTSTREPEDLSFDRENEEEDGFYTVEKILEKEIEVVKPETKEKHPCWVVGGVGALCSIGMAAAATICIFILSKGQLHNKHQHRQNPKIQFHIHTDDKRINQVVQQATRLNHAISTTRARISFGGYYNGI